MKKVITADLGDAKFSALVMNSEKKILNQVVLGSGGMKNGFICDEGSFLRGISFLMDKLNPQDTREVIINLQGKTLKYADITLKRKYFLPKKEISRRILQDFAQMPTPVNDADLILDYQIVGHNIQDRTVTEKRRMIYTDRPYFDRLRSLFKKINFQLIRAYYPLHTFTLSDNKTAVVNLGASNIEIAIYDKKLLQEILLLPIGGEDIIQDIVQLTKISREKARSLLFSYQAMFSTLMNHSLGNSIHHQIIDTRLKEIFNLLKNNLSGKDIKSVFLLGGLKNLSNLSVYLSDYLKIPTAETNDTLPHFYTSAFQMGCYYFDNP